MPHRGFEGTVSSPDASNGQGSLLGPPPTPLTVPPVFSPAAPSHDATASETPQATATNDSGTPLSPPPALPPRLPPRMRTGPTHPPQSPSPAPAATTTSIISPTPVSMSRRSSLTMPAHAPSPVPASLLNALERPATPISVSSSHSSALPVFSHAPPSSSISIRNAKKAHFYLSYLRRAQLDEPFLASTFAIDRHPSAHAQIVIEVEVSVKVPSNANVLLVSRRLRSQCWFDCLSFRRRTRETLTCMPLIVTRSSWPALECAALDNEEKWTFCDH
jgi:hypothetical protein